MRSPDHFLFFSTDIRGDLVYLDENESRHATRVLRLRPGDHLRVTDGAGKIYLCTLEGTAHGCAVARISTHHSAPKPTPTVILHIGIPDRPALEWAIEALTALGIARIVPVICEYCQDKWWERTWEKEAGRLRRKMISAVKQSLNPYLPSLAQPVSLSHDLTGVSGTLIATDPQGASPHTLTASMNRIHAFIGPPGGFSPEETESLRAHGALFVCLSPYRLRTELAAVALAALLMAPRAAMSPETNWPFNPPKHPQ